MEKVKIVGILLCALSVLFITSEYASAIPPSNDNCSSAQAVGNVTNLSFDTSEATFDGPGHVITSANIWYVYTATCTGCATISLCGSDYDTLLAVYDGSTCYPALEDILASNDDFCSRQSQVVIDVVAGNQYLIEIGGYYTWTGTGKLSISCSVGSCQPDNDFCYNAEPLLNANDKYFNTQGATFDGPGHCMDSPNIWYCYTASYSGDVTVSLCGSEYDTKLAIYNGCGCYPSIDDLIECNDDACGFDSEITFSATAGNQYLIEIGGNNSASGQGVINITPESQPCPPTNDGCVNAQPIGNVEGLPYDTTCATFDGPGLCMLSPNIWYCYTAPCTDEVTVSLCGSSYDTVLAVYDGCGCYPTSSRLIGCNDDFCGQQSEITFSAVAGNQYLLEIGGFSSATGQGVLSISCATEPCVVPNDYCFLAQAIGNVVNQPFDTTCATFDGPGLCMTSKNIWYVYTATCSGDATVSLCDSQFDTMLAVYSASNCDPTSSRMIGCNDDFCSRQSQLTFPVTAGSQYLIEVGGYGSSYGQGVITITCEGMVQDKSDLGDAPDSTNNYSRQMTAYPKGGPTGTQARYPTVFSSSGFGPYGPKHLNAEIVAYLGEAITHETEADSGFDEDGINNIVPLQNNPDNDKKDDGVIFPVNMPICSWTTFDYLVNVVTPDTDLWVNVWCDWNRDGDWDDDTTTDPSLACSGRFVTEWAVQNQYLFGLPVGVHQITTPAFVSWHTKNNPEPIWMRITLSEQPWKGGSNPGQIGNGGSGPQAGYLIGETEDYYFVPKAECDICEDMNGDGVIDMNDLTIVVNNWLACCQ
jgi:hypothetical protein